MSGSGKGVSGMVGIGRNGSGAGTFPDSGISKVSQASGREHQTFQRLILPVVAGHEKADSKVVRSLRSILDFAYMAQYPMLSKIDLQKMDELLVVFHKNKEIFISNGSQELDHFNIPKLHTLRHFMDDI